MKQEFSVDLVFVLIPHKKSSHHHSLLQKIKCWGAVPQQLTDSVHTGLKLYHQQFSDLEKQQQFKVFYYGFTVIHHIIKSVLLPRGEIVDSNRLIKSASRSSFKISKNLSAFRVSPKAFYSLATFWKHSLAVTWYLLHQMSGVHKGVLSSLNFERTILIWCCLHTLKYQRSGGQTDLFRDRDLLILKIFIPALHINISVSTLCLEQ